MPDRSQSQWMWDQLWVKKKRRELQHHLSQRRAFSLALKTGSHFATKWKANMRSNGPQADMSELLEFNDRLYVTLCSLDGIDGPLKDSKSLLAEASYQPTSREATAKFGVRKPANRHARRVMQLGGKLASENFTEATLADMGYHELVETVRDWKLSSGKFKQRLAAVQAAVDLDKVR